MGHEHHHEHNLKGKNLFWTILLNLSISIAELIGGLLANSMALLSDATHNFSDVLSLIVSYIATKLTNKKPTKKYTYGFKRSEIIAAFFNSSTLIVLAFFILYEAIVRIYKPVNINPNLVIWLSLLSIIVNGLSVLFIKKDSHDNINIKSAYLHLFGDMLTSIAVFIGGLIMKFFNIYSIDAFFSILIAIYLLYSSWSIFKKSLKIIMQFTPEDIDIDKLANEIKKIDSVKNIHHIHLWQINEHDKMLEAHIDLNDNIKITDFENIKKEITDICYNFKITHITLQPEYSVSDDKKIIHSN